MNLTKQQIEDLTSKEAKEAIRFMQMDKTFQFFLLGFFFFFISFFFYVAHLDHIEDMCELQPKTCLVNLK